MQLTSIKSVQSWIAALHELVTTGNCRDPDFFRPYHLALMGMFLRLNPVAGLALSPKLEGYASRMHLWDAIDCPPPVRVNELDSTGRFQPLVMLRNPEAVDETSRSLLEIFKGAGADDQSLKSADNVVSELLGNCYAHSEVENGMYGLACAQLWSRGNKAQIAIVDTGVGIRHSLQASGLYNEELRTANACELAAEYTVTSKPTRGHSGYGLTLARDLLELNRGALFVVSHDEWFAVRGGCRASGDLECRLPGTLVLLEWNTDIPLDSKKVYDSWPLPEGMTDDDFDF